MQQRATIPKMSRDILRELFGEEGDVSRPLESMFGKAYLDHPDDSRENVADEFGDLAPDLSNISGLVARAIEGAAEIDCQTNQQLLLKHLLSFMEGESVLTWEEGWQTTKHAGDCHNKNCVRLNDIVIMDKLMTPQEMKTQYGDLVKNWKIE